MKKLMMLLVLGLVLTGALWAAGAQESAAEEVTLSVLWFNDANESEVFMDTIQDYLEANPNVKVDLQLVPFSDYEKRLKLMIAGGNPPDLARVTNNHVAMFVNELLPLDGNVENLDAVLKGFSPASLAFATHPDGSILALPTEATANGMIVNVDLFADAGIDIRELSKSWDWDDWYDAMQQVKRGNPGLKYALGYDFSPHRWSTILYQAGGRFLNEDETAMNFNTPETIDALTFFKKLHDDDLIPPSVWMGSENPQELFQAGLVASHIGGSWLINAYANEITDFEWAAVQMPKRAIRSSVAGGKFIASFKGAENEEAALDLMLAFSDPEHNSMYCRDTFNLSGRTDVTIEYASRSDDFNALASDLNVTPAITAEDWKSPELNKIYSYIREQIVEGLLENISMKQAAQNIHDEGNKYF
ncbi:MAG: sugar ABC transporter substrate-binding protein [Sphaerochaetaceae bacterium]|nr:sugar ABC transporter substrate-binding protein [Sphaerochaetaceae bacterium]